MLVSLWRVIFGLVIALQIMEATVQREGRSGGSSGSRHGYDQAAFGRYAYDEVSGLCGGAGQRGFGKRATRYATSDPVPRRFTGKERDAETGLDYFGARYMASAQGRFTSPDAPLLDQHPEDPQSWNLFSYVRNNPLTFIDPTGNDCIYTNDFSSDGTVSVETGNCSKKGGTFVDGTVDVKSITYDRKKNELGYSYANAEKETGGAGTIGLKSEPTQDDLRLAALGQAGQLASPVTDPRFIAGWYGAAALAGGAGVLASQVSWMQVGIGPTNLVSNASHMVYGVNGVFQHGLEVGGQMLVRGGIYAARTYAQSPFKLSVPVLYGGKVLAQEGAKVTNCVTACISAFARGWGF